MKIVDIATVSPYQCDIHITITLVVGTRSIPRLGGAQALEDHDVGYVFVWTGQGSTKITDSLYHSSHIEFCKSATINRWLHPSWPQALYLKSFPVHRYGRLAGASGRSQADQWKKRVEAVKLKCQVLLTAAHRTLMESMVGAGRLSSILFRYSILSVDTRANPHYFPHYV